MRYSKGVSWISNCRIPHSEEIMVASSYKETKQSENGWNTKNRILEPSNRGRFPANILVSDDMLNDGNKPNKGHRAKGKVSGYGEFGGGKSEYHGIGEYMAVDSTSRYYDIDKWFNNLIDV